ncbi:MAG TPA: indolepyruvate oxidoreductase subunit beta [Chitinispirillaceae bacterium]|jgi:indolepyruvate ferredoxin oxidoreductase beta subunit|nr:indolepyruvate oxidoreductase subunit beta [Chitinispirillaceae bacterium]
MNIIIAAVGGQGALLASRVIGQVAMGQGYEVKLSEVHGMSQRGGSVISFVRYGSNISSPVVEKGSADFILGLELLEAARYIDYLKVNGTIICNTQRIAPMTVITGAQKYPESIIDDLKKLPITIYTLDALTLAREAGNVKTVNSVILGSFAGLSSIDFKEWQEGLKNSVPQRFHDANLKALKSGFDALQGSRQTTSERG